MSYKPKTRKNLKMSLMPSGFHNRLQDSVLMKIRKSQNGLVSIRMIMAISLYTKIKPTEVALYGIKEKTKKKPLESTMINLLKK